jgi:hypothetical protein
MPIAAAREAVRSAWHFAILPAPSRFSYWSTFSPDNLLHSQEKEWHHD